MTKNHIGSFLSLIYCFSYFTGLAQQPYLEYFGKEEGLEFHEVTAPYYSKDGKLWMSHGGFEAISCYDGVRFKNYNLKELNLPYPVLAIAEDSRGLWFQKWENDAFLLYQGDTWQYFRLNGSHFYFLDSLSQELHFIDKQMQLYQLDKDTFKLSPYGSPLQLTINSKEEEWKLLTFLSGKGHYIECFDEADDLWKYYSTDLIPGSQPKLIGTCQQNDKLRFFTPSKYYAFSYESAAVYYYENRKKQKKISINLGKNQGSVLSNFTIQTPNKVSSNLKYGYIATGPNNQWKYIFAPHSPDSLILWASHLPNSVDVQGTQTPSGEFWLSSNEGLLHVNPSMLEFSSTDGNMVSGLHTINEDSKGNIWFGGYTNSGFIIYDGTNFRRPSDVELHKLRVLPGSMSYQEEALLFFYENQVGLGIIENEKFEHLKTDIPKFTGFYLKEMASGQIAAAYTELGIIDTPLTNPLKISVKGIEKGLKLSRILSITEDKNQRLWLGRFGEGMAVYTPVQDTIITWRSSPTNPKSFGIICSVLDKNNNLWFGGDKGLFVLEAPDQFPIFEANLFDRTQFIPLPGGDLSPIFFITEHHDYIVVGTQVAIHFLDLKDYSKNSIRPLTYSLFYGKDIHGNGSEQNTVLTDSKGFLWVGTHDGAVRIEVDKLVFDTTFENIIVKEFKAGNEIISGISPENPIKIPKEKRNIQFTYETTGNPNLQDYCFFDIYIITQQGDTILQVLDTKEKTFSIPYLPAGQHRLEIKSKKHNKYQTTLIQQFQIPLLLEENVWLWALVGLGISLLGIIFLWYRFRQRKIVLEQRLALEQAKRQQDELKAHSIANFFNPHFINNALHWLQSRYRKDDASALIIDKLAANVEQISNATRLGRTYHTLAEEFKLVQDYLTVQQIRFGKQLQIELPQWSDLKPFSNIPILVTQIQIHVENAIEHGIRNVDTLGIVKVKFYDDNSFVKLIIEDNGLGRKKGGRSELNRNSSTKMLNQLIAIYNEYNPIKINIQYEDFIFKNDSRPAYGTRVILLIPKKYQYEIK